MTGFALKASRPGLWFQTLWLYLLPTSQQTGLLTDFEFWVGVAFVTFPLNLLVYGWNDVVDYEIDRRNPRKDSFLFGARGTRQELAQLPGLIVAVNLPFVVVLTWFGGWAVALILGAMVAANAAYNRPRGGLRSVPPLELLNQLGYLLILPLSSVLNGVPQVRGSAVLYLVLFCTHAHLMGEIMDVEPDRRSGRRTTATVLGKVPSKLLVLLLVACEGGFLFVAFDELFLAVFLWLGALWLLLDVLALYRDRPYTRQEFRLFGLGLNAAGFASIAWVWWRGSLS